MSSYGYLFDAEGQDHQVKLDREVIEAVGDSQLLWVDLTGEEEAVIRGVTDMLELSNALLNDIFDTDGSLKQLQRPRLDLYSNCFYLNVQAVQERSGGDPDDKPKSGIGSRSGNVSFRLIMVHFVVFANIVLTIHSEPATFLESFDRRIKGDTHLGSLDGPAFVGALLNWHITGFFRAVETLESEVDRIDDAALLLRRNREERDLLVEMVKARRRLAVVRRALLPHREVYATMARPRFAPFVTAHASETLQLLSGRLDRAIEATENARELVLGSFDIFATQTALRTNEVVKILTVVSALLLPAGVIANLAVLFIRSPVYDLGRVGLWAVLTGLALFGTTFVTVARRRSWI